MTTDQAYDRAATGETGEAGPFLVLTDQTLTERPGESDGQPPTCNTGVVPGQWLTRLPCMARPIQPGDLVMINVETGETRPMRCQRNGCPDCIGDLAFMVVLLAAIGGGVGTVELLIWLVILGVGVALIFRRYRRARSSTPDPSNR